MNKKTVYGLGVVILLALLAACQSGVVPQPGTTSQEIGRAHV